MWDLKYSGALDQQAYEVELGARGVLLKQGYVVQADPDLSSSCFRLQSSGMTALKQCLA